MAFKDGHKKVGGITAGGKHPKTKQWEELGLMHEEGGADTANKIMSAYAKASINDDGSINDEAAEKFMEHYKSLLEYFKPKQSRVENRQDGDTIIRIVRD